MDELLGAFADFLSESLWFIRRFKYTIMVIVLIVASIVALYWHQHQEEQDCRSKGGVVVPTEYSVACIYPREGR